MIQVKAQDLCVDFPVYEHKSRSLRHHLVINRVSDGFKRLRKTTTHPVGANVITDEKGKRIIKALDHISFTLNRGDRLGIVGHNGAGKSTLLKAIAGIYEPVSGTMKVSGMVSPLFNMSDGMDPDSTGYENIWLRSRVLGISTHLIEKSIDEIADFSQLGDYLDMPIRTYSSGMMVRLAFAITTTVKHEILVMDEMIGAGDAAFIDQANKRLEEFVERSGILVIATHSPDTMLKWCNMGMLLSKGRSLAVGGVQEILDLYGAQGA